MKKAFTLAEALITLGIIGVVAAMTIPAVIVNVNQQEYKTALRKAVSTLNDAIALNIALDGKSPKKFSVGVKALSDNNPEPYFEALFNYLKKNLSVIKSTIPANASSNYIFYTADGIKFEIPHIYPTSKRILSHENGQLQYIDNVSSCGSAGFPDSSGYTPCVVAVDVNGDKNPNQTGIDRFLLLITESRVIPYGVAAQKLMYGDEN